MPLVMFSKVRRAKSEDDFETWNDTGVSNTLNNFDNGDVRTNECVICLEGNGARPSHNGDGYIESDAMYTLNTIERHAVAYGLTTKGNGDAFISKERHTSLSSGGGQPGQGYPAVVHPKVAGTLDASYYKGCGERNGIERDVVAYAMQSMGEYKESERASAMKMRDYKAATDLIVEKKDEK